MEPRSDLPGLLANERAFQLSDGTLVVVAVTRTDETSAGTPVSTTLHFQARQVNEDGTPGAFKAPMRSHTVPVEAFTNGTDTVASIAARRTVEAVEFFQKLRLADAAWRAYPVEFPQLQA